MVWVVIFFILVGVLIGYVLSALILRLGTDGVLRIAIADNETYIFLVLTSDVVKLVSKKNVRLRIDAKTQISQD